MEKWITENGYIKDYRNIMQTPIWQNDRLYRVWSWCLYKATYKPYDAQVGLQTIHLESGQFVYGLHKAAEEVGYPKTSVDRYLKKLKKMGYVGIKHTNKYSIITIENWDSFQNSDSDNSNNVGNKWETDGNIQEMKENNNKKRFGEFKNVLLSDKEYQALKNRFPDDYMERIENLSSYMESTGKKYKNHYATIVRWARNKKPK